MLSGLGSIEGGVFTTPTNGKTLYQPRDLPGAGNNRNNAMNMTTVKSGAAPNQPPQARPAYSDHTLAEVLRWGRDPAGRELDMVMPRYQLQDSDMAIMVSYLKELANDYSPGVDKYAIHFATVIAGEVPAEQVAAMMEPLESFVKSANKQQEDFEAQRVKLREFAMEPTYRRVKLSRWLLKGDPNTWRSQLDDYYRKEPVFALIAGISLSDWRPVHEFCEVNKIPAILPDTDFPVVSANDRYTLYFSKGYYQEGEAAARYLPSQDRSLQGKKIVQVISDTPAGRAIAEGFSRTLEGQGLPAPVTIRQPDAAPFTTRSMQLLIEKEKPDLLALWTGAETLRQMGAIAATGQALPTLMVSAGYLGKDLWTIPEQLRDSTYITYPYRLPQDDARYERFLTPADKNMKMSPEIRVSKSRVYSTLKVMTQALREMKGNFYRDYLFDVIGMKGDIEFPLYERLSFGPDQRYAAKGCYIVQLAKGKEAELIKKSEWVIH
jgi:ABC-type branched-subunit amino acid transport system substrate-binding protein